MYTGYGVISHMSLQTTKTTITIDTGLLNRLKLFSRFQNKSVSKIIAEAVQEKIKTQDRQRIEHIYQELDNLQERMKDAKPDPQYEGMSVDEILYGQHGVWSTNNRRNG